MDPILRALLLSWDLRPEVLLTLGLLGGLQLFGWRRVRQRSRGRFATPLRLLSYQGGLLVVAVALVSPIDVLAGQLFFMHMIQHLLLVMIAPPLLLLANPFPFLIWALPSRMRSRVARWFQADGVLRGGLQQVTGPGLVWLAFITALFGWHDPDAYNLTLRSSLAHDIEHLSFFVTAMLFWWHVVGAGPRIHGRFPVAMRIGYVLVTIIPNMVTGVFLAFASQPIYTHYLSVPRLWGLSVLDDQMWGGIIMWIPGSMMYILAALVLVARVMGAEDDKPLPTAAEWSNEENMIMPGLEHRATQNKWRRLESP